MQSTQRTVLLTGASGFVGGAVWRELHRRGCRVLAVGRRSQQQLDAPVRDLATDTYLGFDLAGSWPGTMQQWLAEADTVVHAAARSSPWGSRRAFRRANIDATQKLLDGCRQQGLPKLVFISSSSVYYQPHDQMGIQEDDPLAPRPINHYAWSKQVGESLVRQYERPATILRPRAVYGTGDTVLFPRILAAARAGRLPLLIRDSGPVVGDLIAIENLSSMVADAALDDSISGTFNLTDDCPVPIIEFLLDVFQRLGIARPKRQLSVAMAHRLAWGLETVYRVGCPWLEPPITRFGVHVFAWSKTFDVSRMLSTFGPPAISTEQAVQRFVAWMKPQLK